MCHESFLQFVSNFKVSMQGEKTTELIIKVRTRNCVSEIKSKIRAEQKHSRLHLERLVRTCMPQVTYVHFHGFKIHLDIIK